MFSNKLVKVLNGNALNKIPTQHKSIPLSINTSKTLVQALHQKQTSTFFNNKKSNRHNYNNEKEYQFKHKKNAQDEMFKSDFGISLVLGFSIFVAGIVSKNIYDYLFKKKEKPKEKPKIITTLEFKENLTNYAKISILPHIAPNSNSTKNPLKDLHEEFARIGLADINTSSYPLTIMDDFIADIIKQGGTVALGSTSPDVIINNAIENFTNKNKNLMVGNQTALSFYNKIITNAETRKIFEDEEIASFFIATRELNVHNLFGNLANLKSHQALNNEHMLKTISVLEDPAFLSVYQQLFQKKLCKTNANKLVLNESLPEDLPLKDLRKMRNDIKQYKLEPKQLEQILLAIADKPKNRY